MVSPDSYSTVFIRTIRFKNMHCAFRNKNNFEAVRELCKPVAFILS
jgi:hypothetical protein